MHILHNYTIPLAMQRESADFPGAFCDKSANVDDGCRWWYLNSWALGPNNSENQPWNPGARLFFIMNMHNMHNMHITNCRICTICTYENLHNMQNNMQSNMYAICKIICIICTICYNMHIMLYAKYSQEYVN